MRCSSLLCAQPDAVSLLLLGFLLLRCAAEAWMVIWDSGGVQLVVCLAPQHFNLSRSPVLFHQGQAVRKEGTYLATFLRVRTVLHMHLVCEA